MRELDSPEAFEAGKRLRVMPAKLRAIRVVSAYTLRIMSPPGESPFAMDMLSLVEGVDPDEREGFIKVRTFIKPVEEKPAISLPFLVSPLGYIVMKFETEAQPNPPEIDMGYYLDAQPGDDLLTRQIAEPAPGAVPVTSGRPLVPALQSTCSEGIYGLVTGIDLAYCEYMKKTTPNYLDANGTKSKN